MSTHNVKHKHFNRILLVVNMLLFSLLVDLTIAKPTEWKLVEKRITTPWAKEVSPDNVHTEYPRPQMVRKEWLNLNGLWDYAILPKDEVQPTDFQGKILVPFCIESTLSGVNKSVGGENKLWYRRTFEVPDNWNNKKVLLHFGAVDWKTTVWLNGKKIGTHRGGYDPFTFDITDSLTAETQEIILSVWDPIDKGYQPRGKQVTKPGGVDSLYR